MQEPTVALVPECCLVLCCLVLFVPYNYCLLREYIDVQQQEEECSEARLACLTFSTDFLVLDEMLWVHGSPRSALHTAM